MSRPLVDAALALLQSDPTLARDAEAQANGPSGLTALASALVLAHGVTRMEAEKAVREALKRLT